jgi:hypothetical protein
MKKTELNPSSNNAELFYHFDNIRKSSPAKILSRRVIALIFIRVSSVAKNSFALSALHFAV